MSDNGNRFPFHGHQDAKTHARATATMAALQKIVGFVARRFHLDRDEDARQDLLLKLWESLPKFDAGRHNRASTYAYSILENEAREIHRRKHTRVAEFHHVMSEIPADTVSPTIDPGDEAARREWDTLAAQADRWTKRRIRRRAKSGQTVPQ